MAIRLNQDTVLARTDDGTVLLHQRTGRYWQLNRTGTAILDQLLAGATPNAVATELTSRHGIDLDQAHTDISRLTCQLRAAKLLEPGV